MKKVLLLGVAIMASVLTVAAARAQDTFGLLRGLSAEHVCVLYVSAQHERAAADQ